MIKAPNLGAQRSRRRSTQRRPRENPPQRQMAPRPDVRVVQTLVDDGAIELGGAATVRKDVSVLLELAWEWLEEGAALERKWRDLEEDGATASDRRKKRVDETIYEYRLAALYAMWAAIGLWGAVLSGQFPNGEWEWRYAVELANAMHRQHRTGPRKLTANPQGSGRVNDANYELYQGTEDHLTDDVLLDRLLGPYATVASAPNDIALSILRSVLDSLDPDWTIRHNYEADTVFNALQEAVAFENPSALEGEPYMDWWIKKHKAQWEE